MLSLSLTVTGSEFLLTMLYIEVAYSFFPSSKNCKYANMHLKICTKSGDALADHNLNRNFDVSLSKQILGVGIETVFDHFFILGIKSTHAIRTAIAVAITIDSGTYTMYCNGA